MPLKYQYWQTNILSQKRALKQTDGQILTIEVTSEPSGDWIYIILKKISQKVGIPLQIIADHAPNLKKGIQLFQNDYPQVIYTYDVTHAMANLLKKELLTDEVFQKFLQKCHHCRQLVQQTELAFAAPPPQRSQCRYFNLDSLVHWASQILKCDFAIFSRLLPYLTFDQLMGRLEEKFAWLKDYIEEIRLWKHLLFLTRTLEKQLKTFGLNWTSLSRYSYQLSLQRTPDFLLYFRQQILNYLAEEFPDSPDRTLLATSDVLESIFGWGAEVASAPL